ncbi:MAG: aspartate aminotransferase family protein [Gammaproteobacteria bacterium]
MNIEDSALYREFVTRNAASRAHAERVRRVVPTGTSRALLRHPPFPFFTVRAAGAHSWDLDGNRRIDFHNNYTAMLHGHAHPAITDVVARQLTGGSAYSTPSVQEEALAALLCERVPALDQVVFNNSGTEAVMVALRAARALTGRHRIGKFEGAYHGSSDFVMVGGHGLPAPDDPRRVTVPLPDIGGLPPAATADVLLIRYNDPEAVRAAVQRHGHELATIIVEPVLGAGGVIPAEREFLQVLRAETARAGIVLICDEVITLRQSAGGAQAEYGIAPDLTTMAKIIGGGFPIGAVGGRRDCMRVFEDPSIGGTVANLGTFSGNAVSVAAGFAAMALFDADAANALNGLGASLRERLTNVLARHGAAAQVTGAGSLFQIHWTRTRLRDARGAERGDPTLRLLTFLGLANRGIHISARGMGCLSTPMTSADLDAFAGALDDTLIAMLAEGWPVQGP